MAFHALIAVPLSAERPGGLSGRSGTCHARAVRTRQRTEVHHTNPSAFDTRVSMVIRPALAADPSGRSRRPRRSARLPEPPTQPADPPRYWLHIAANVSMRV